MFVAAISLALALPVAQSAPYRITILDTEDGAIAAANVIDDLGRVGGSHGLTGQSAFPVVWQADGSRLVLDSSGLAGSVFATGAPDQWFGSIGVGAAEAAWSWSGSGGSAVGPQLGIFGERALGGNYSGWSVGASQFDVPQLYAQPWVRDPSGQFIDLASFGFDDAIPADVNVWGDVVGSDVGARYPRGAAGFAWSVERPLDIVRTSQLTRQPVRLAAVTDARVAIGSVLDDNQLPVRAFAFDVESLMGLELEGPNFPASNATAALDGNTLTSGLGNGSGQVVGFARSPLEFRAAIWFDGEGYLVDNIARDIPAGISLETATSINELGEFCGTALQLSPFRVVAYRATPLIPTATPILPGFAGRPNWLSAQGFEAGEDVTFVLGTRLGDFSLGCVTLGVADPYFVATVPADADGRAQVRFIPPASFEGFKFYSQAFQASSCQVTELRVRTMQPKSAD